MRGSFYYSKTAVYITYVWIVGEREKTKELKKCLFPFFLTKQEEQCLNWLGSLGCGLECKRTSLEYHFDEQNEIRLSIAFISQWSTNLVWHFLPFICNRINIIQKPVPCVVQAQVVSNS